jgi:zinc protease
VYTRQNPAVGAASDAEARPRLIPFQKLVLPNGLEVVLHEDHSEPVVAVYVYYHVGSSREEPGRSGFAHLFEHMLFQGSQHVPDNDHFRLIQEAGGALNGTTNQDRTNYFETLPAEELELALWLESDRMGFLLPAMTQEKLDNQRDVVMNERRQSYENQPYGLVHETLLAALYPSGHPYSWPTIGAMADIRAARLEDVAAFFRRWYGPNNATLAIGGDFEPARALALVERYFGLLPAGPPVARPAPQPAGLAATRRVVLEDRVQQPQLTLCWPTVPAGHPEEAALDLLADVLSANRSSLLDKALMIDEELASLVTIAHAAQERAGALTIHLRPHARVTLSRLEERVEELLGGLGERGVDPERLRRLLRRREGEVFRALETVAARTSRLGFDNLFHGDPGRLELELERHRAVRPADVSAVLRRYLLGRPRVVLSCVPRGRAELAAAERPLERTVFPPDGPRATAPRGRAPRPFRSPPMWTSALANGVSVLGSSFDKVPMTRLSLSLPAGRAREGALQRGLASLTAEMLEEGTRRLSGTELVDELDGLGAQLAISAGDEDLVLRLSVLDECLPRAAELLCELVLEPRFDAADFERVRRARLVEIDTRSDRIHELAEDGFARLVFGPDHPKGAPRLGTRASIAALTPDVVGSFWSAQARAGGARLCVVGSRDAARVAELFAPLEQRWPADPTREHPPVRPAGGAFRPRPGLRLHLIDKPGAAQSELRLGHLGVASGDPDYYPLQALNHVLGGAFSSRLNLNLREDKGYTYGVHSRFEGGLTPGAFTVDCAVASPVTAAALAEAHKELEGIRAGIRPAEVEFARKSLSRALARSLESTLARLHLLESIARYGYPLDVLERRLAWLGQTSATQLDELARCHVRPDALEVLVVGDRAQVLEPLRELGWGEVLELDHAGEPLVAGSA